MQKEINLASEVETEKLGSEMGSCVDGGTTIYLVGTLGAGKTTFCRGLLRGLGYSGSVKSPTYTLVEPYKFFDFDVYHFDLFRLSDPEELEYIGIRDYFNNGSLCVVEWPNRGEGFIAKPDLRIEFLVSGKGRTATMRSESELGHSCIKRFDKTAI